MIELFNGLKYEEIVQGTLTDEYLFLEKTKSGKKGVKEFLIDRRTLEVTDEIRKFNNLKEQDLNVLLVNESGDIIKAHFTEDNDTLEFFKKRNSRLITRR